MMKKKQLMRNLCALLGLQQKQSWWREAIMTKIHTQLWMTEIAGLLVRAGFNTGRLYWKGALGKSYRKMRLEILKAKVLPKSNFCWESISSDPSGIFTQLSLLPEPKSLPYSKKPPARKRSCSVPKANYLLYLNMCWNTEVTLQTSFLW